MLFADRYRIELRSEPMTIFLDARDAASDKRDGRLRSHHHWLSATYVEPTAIEENKTLNLCFFQRKKPNHYQ